MGGRCVARHHVRCSDRGQCAWLAKDCRIGSADNVRAMRGESCRIEAGFTASLRHPPESTSTSSRNRATVDVTKWSRLKSLLQPNKPQGGIRINLLGQARALSQPRLRYAARTERGTNPRRARSIAPSDPENIAMEIFDDITSARPDLRRPQ
jgi:hypothetical protein